jgi:dye decolorizing peroxidase
MVGGSMLVLRRIRMDFDTWDDFGRAGKELVMARRLSDGAPVTGGRERDRPDTTKTDSAGLPVVDPGSHVVRATPRNPAERMLRRGYSFDDGPSTDGTPQAGLLFAAFQADAATAFVPVQRRLAETDALNTWVTHVGSAAFALPPGCARGEFLGQRLLGA